MLIFILSLAWATPKEWTLVSQKDGVKTEKQDIPNSSLFAFRGEVITDIPLGKLSSLILDDDKGPQWVDLMYLSKTIEKPGDNVKIIHQGYDLPWPIQDRDYVMKQTYHYDDATKVFTLHFESIQHPSMPTQDCCVRAMTYKTFWRLRVLKSGKTKAEVEVITDPKGSLPAWLINLIQEDWPYKTLTSLIARVKKGDIEMAPQAASWQ